MIRRCVHGKEALDILEACHNGPTGELRPNFKVNGHRLKHYFGGDIPAMDIPDLQTFPKDNYYSGNWGQLMTLNSASWEAPHALSSYP
ncbi:hypothetical protein Tco_1082220 [Tanacetum coccineum]|uniref:Uncharacterized protein n=1 Tax=Tanacetum coccineum TaxID=301880 RepID=A0ABQ5I188_9ASTR